MFVWQSGENRIARNLIHHLAYNAVVISGVRPGNFRSRSASRRECTRTIRWDEVGEARDWHQILPFLHARNNVFEDNEIHHAMQYLGDGNAVYVSGCGEGNIIRRNYIHDMEAATSAQAAIRTDGWQRGTLVSENVIVSCACGVIRKNYNHVENNVIVDARADIGAIAFRHFPEDEQTTGSRVQRNICVQRRGPAPFYAVREPPPASGRFTTPADCHADFNLFYNLADPADGERFLARIRQHHRPGERPGVGRDRPGVRSRPRIGGDYESAGHAAQAAGPAGGQSLDRRLTPAAVARPARAHYFGAEVAVQAARADRLAAAGACPSAFRYGFGAEVRSAPLGVWVGTRLSEAPPPHMIPSMPVPDFQRSFLTFTRDDDRKQSKTRSHAAPYRFNAARIQLESVCTLTGAGGATQRYVLGASCKSEIVGLDRDLWLHPNADFCPVASESGILILKSWITNQT